MSTRRSNLSPLSQSLVFALTLTATVAQVEAQANTRLPEVVLQASVVQQAHIGDVLDGHIEEVRSFDVFALNVVSGTTIDLEVQARSIGSRLDPTLGLFDENGERLAFDIDSDGLGGRVHLTAPESGRYFVVVRGFGGSGGDEHNYRLTIDGLAAQSATPQADFN